ncbi:MAG: flippase-like domain-containing protein [Candidatus Thermoplasmatota archaeon]|nr:flippase-like domain-containing protein [Candidatus Thermoplasmatota archaeon]
MPGKKMRTVRWFTLASLLFFFIVIVVLLLSMGRDILDEIRGLNPLYVLLSMACFLGVQLSWSIKYYLLVRRGVRKAWFPYVALSSMAGNFVNITTPSGRMAGEPVRAKMIASCYNSRFSRVFASAMIDKASLTIAMISLLVPLTVYATITFNMPRFLQYLTGSFVLFWIIIGIISYLIFRYLGEKQSKRVGSLIHKVSRFLLRSRSKERSYYVEKFKSGLVEFRSSFRFLAKNPVYMGVDLFLGVMIYSFRFASAYMLFIAVGHSVPFFTVAMVVMVSFTIGLLSQMPGMIGVGETTMTYLYYSVGIEPAIAFTVSVMTQMNSYLFEIGLGYLSMLAMNFILESRKKKRASLDPPHDQ